MMPTLDAPPAAAEVDAIRREARRARRWEALRWWLAVAALVAAVLMGVPGVA